jgi:hypothetical protein
MPGANAKKLPAGSGLALLLAATLPMPSEPSSAAGAAASLRRRSCSTAWVCSRTTRRRARWRRSSARVLRQWCPLRGAHTFEPFRDLALGRSQSANAEACENRLHLVHHPRLLSDQILPLTVRSPRVLLFDRRDCLHAAMTPLAAGASDSSRTSSPYADAQFSFKLAPSPVGEDFGLIARATFSGSCQRR